MASALEGLDELRGEFRGTILLPGDGAAFQEALQVWAVSPIKGNLPEPALVVQPRGTADVVAAIKFATRRGLGVAAKCGGHGSGGPSIVEGGMVIHFGLMRSVYVDPGAKTAVVDGGCLVADVDAETSLHGLAAPLGVCPTVGIGGLALNGGLSLLSRTVGAACDNVLEAQMVLADGSVVNVTQESDPELWWAIRGAGTALGVVTKLKLRLYDVSQAFSGVLVWPDDPQHATYKAIMRWIRSTVFPNPHIGFNVTRALHPEMGPMIISMVVVLGDGPREDKEALLKPLRELGPVQDTVGQSSWRQTQSTHGPAIEHLTATFPVHYETTCGGHVEADKFSDQFFEDWVKHSCDELPLPDCALTLSFLELAGGKLKESKGPVGLQTEIQWVTQVGWADPASHASGMRYGAALQAAMAPYNSARTWYINMDDVVAAPSLTHQEAVARVGGEDRLERLRAVKARVDPDNLFRNTSHARVLAARAP